MKKTNKISTNENQNEMLLKEDALKNLDNVAYENIEWTMFGIPQMPNNHEIKKTKTEIRQDNEWTMFTTLQMEGTKTEKKENKVLNKKFILNKDSKQVRFSHLEKAI